MADTQLIEELQAEQSMFVQTAHAATTERRRERRMF